MRDKKLTIKLTQDERDQIKNIANSTKVGVSTAARQLIWKGMQYNEWLVGEITKVIRDAIERRQA